jgi:hypothetical protein
VSGNVEGGQVTTGPLPNRYSRQGQAATDPPPNRYRMCLLSRDGTPVSAPQLVSEPEAFYHMGPLNGAPCVCYMAMGHPVLVKRL